MSELDDHDLLARYARDNSEAAFAAFAERHVNLVYSTALRSVGNPHAAEEIAQAVFIILANKAEKLSRRVVLSGWLYQTTRLTAANFLRGEIRRQKREQEAYMQSTLNEPENNAWPQIAPLLDDALGKLGEADRNAIVLRFFENKNLREVGAALGASEDVAKMRVNRALEKLRKIFTKRGVTLSATLIAGAVSASSVQAAPVGLVKTITVVAVAKGATAGVSTLALVKGALKIMAWTKAKTVIVSGVVLLLAAGTTTITVKEIERHSDSQWDIGRIDGTILRNAPHIVKIIPTKFPNQGGWASIENGRVLGLGVQIDDIIEAAYEDHSAARTILLTHIPRGKYDFIANLLSGSNEALRQEIETKFGVIGRHETVETNVLFLQIESRNASGLKPDLIHNGSSSRNEWGEYNLVNGELTSFANFLESQLGIPVIDQTDLTGDYDVNLKWDYRNDPQHDNLKQAVNEQLGLELVSGTAPVEMLVVDKAN
jgi:uncharacterized protein (TIGR03435 family)